MYAKQRNVDSFRPNAYEHSSPQGRRGEGSMDSQGRWNRRSLMLSSSLLLHTVTTGCRHFLNDLAVLTSKINNLALTCHCSLKTSVFACSLRISHSFRLGRVPVDSGSLWSTNGLWRYYEQILLHGGWGIASFGVLRDKQSLPQRLPTVLRDMLCSCSSSGACHHLQKVLVVGQTGKEPNSTAYT